MRETQVNGRRVAYHDHGSGYPVVMLHPGFIADGMVPLLSQDRLSDVRTIAPHRRGYGSSDGADAPVTMADLADDVVGLLDDLGIETCALVGHSFGACVALEVARRARTRVASLALIEPPLGSFLSPESTAVLMGVVGQALPQFGGGAHAAAVDTWLNGAFGPGWQDVVEGAIPGGVDQATRDAPAAFGLDLGALQTWPFGPDDLLALDTPMLSIVHRQTGWTGFAEVHQGLIAAGAEERVVDLPSHLMQILDPALVADAIADSVAATART